MLVVMSTALTEVPEDTAGLLLVRDCDSLAMSRRARSACGPAFLAGMGWKRGQAGRTLRVLPRGWSGGCSCTALHA